MYVNVALVLRLQNKLLDNNAIRAQLLLLLKVTVRPSMCLQCVEEDDL